MGEGALAEGPRSPCSVVHVYSAGRQWLGPVASPCQALDVLSDRLWQELGKADIHDGIHDGIHSVVERRV